MLKRVAVSDVQMGMFIHKMEGNWFKHPFWKSKFLLDDPENLDDLRASYVETVIIDTAKGKDILRAPQSASAAAASSPRKDTRPASERLASSRVASLKSRQSVDLRSTAPTSTAKETKTAAVVADKAQKVIAKAFGDARLGKTVNMRKVEPLVEDIYASLRRNPHAFSGLMRCKLNNEFVYRHALAVSALMVSLACKMKLSPDLVREAGMAGLFLDIGVNRLPKDAAAPNGDYSNAPPHIWQQHVQYGEQALAEAGGFPEAVVGACLQHHERMDGSGFPNGLKGDQIGQLARMAAICDSFNYMLVDGDGSAAMDPAEAVSRLRDMCDKFDPVILRHFVEAVGIYPVGSFVRLRSDRLAMVIDEDPEDVDQPTVSTFYSLETNERILPTKIELARCYGKDAIVGIADLSGLVLPEPEQLRELIFLQTHKLKK
ncbi:MAG: DUF3391 domain-containing protein [Sphingomonadaceae bacterium]